MNYFNFLQNYLKLQEDVMFSKLIPLNNSTISYSETDKSIYWNNALTNSLLPLDEINEINRIMTSLQRTPTIYFINNNYNNPLLKLLEVNNYSKGFEDSYLFYQKSDVDQTHFSEIIKVIDENQLKIWLNTANSCYQKNDPQNPYGELEEFLDIAQIIWNKHHESNRAEYFLAYNKDKPVAVSILTNYKDQGYISCVGSLKEVRGQGYGKAITLYAVQQSIKNGHEYHYLSTEEGHYPHQFYLRIGFDELFKALGYTKN